MLNKFLAAGRLTADPEVQTKGDNRLCKFSIACERPKRKGDDTAETDFFNCTAWNRNADVIADWFRKGDMITLVGSVHINRYEKNGTMQSYTEVTVDEIHFTGGKKKENEDKNSEFNGNYSSPDPLFWIMGGKENGYKATDHIDIQPEGRCR